ncbi:MAG: hypothetical protein H6623_09350 [Bdellovibrionaceae bacterium]|nr:hypothetical protein [Pseudobdellovibrionaceae bacterium]
MNTSILTHALFIEIVKVVSETNGLSLNNTLELILDSSEISPQVRQHVKDFQDKLDRFRINLIEIDALLQHPVAEGFYQLFQKFPLKYREEHIHLTGSLTAEFVYPRLMELLKSPHKTIYEKKIDDVFGIGAHNIKSVADVEKLMRLQDTEQFDRYLEILLLPKLILLSRQAHADAAYSMAQDLYHKYNVGAIRLKFTLSRVTQTSKEEIPGADNVSSEDVVLGLYEGFKLFQDEHSDFQFILSPCFRKEPLFFDAKRYKTKRDHFEAQVAELIDLVDNHPELKTHVTEVDTVGSEKDLFRKEHFQEMKVGLRKLHSRGFKIRSHHGETWLTLRRGIQSVDNAMNIWHVDAIEHGLSLGINPNFYFHTLFHRIMEKNKAGQPIEKGTKDYNELQDLDWNGRNYIGEKLEQGIPLNDTEKMYFVKSKFHLATEMEHYQHDVLNRMLDKELSVIALPSSNKKLTGQFDDYKEHPFSWWEKKGMKLGVGTDNYYTLNTNYIREMLILLLTDPVHLKIMKLLMVCTGEKRRPYLSQLLWSMRKKALGGNTNE